MIISSHLILFCSTLQMLLVINFFMKHFFKAFKILFDAFTDSFNLFGKPDVTKSLKQTILNTQRI